jgi:NADP-dependent 3-hydroxy acid dehydrogenase YdfG
MVTGADAGIGRAIAAAVAREGMTRKSSGRPSVASRWAVRTSPGAIVTGQSFTVDGGLEMNWGQGA